MLIVLKQQQSPSNSSRGVVRILSCEASEVIAQHVGDFDRKHSDICSFLCGFRVTMTGLWQPLRREEE